MEIQWKEISMQEREVIESFYQQESVRNCDFTFANNILWAPFYETKYGILEDMLVFTSGTEEESVSFPLGNGDLKKAVDALTVFFQEREKPFQMHLVSPEQFQRLEELYPGRFQVTYQRDSADYVYEAEKLRSLSGKKLHGKRNHIHRFKDNFPDWQYEPITEENVEECVEMAQQWKVDNGCSERGRKHEEFCITLRALRNREELGLRGGLIRAGGRVVAFSLGEPCGKDMFVVHIEKAYAEIQGAYPMINQQFVEHEAEGYTYVNREEDLGEEGLRKAKLSYSPVFLLEKGVVTECRGSQEADTSEEE